MTTQITLNNDQNALHIDNNDVKHFVLEVLSFFEVETDEVIIHFVSEERIKLLHGLFFNDTSTTDCISFPIDGKNKKLPEITHTLGECFINPKEAVFFLPENPYEEVCRYIIHCILHFIGYTDKTKKSKDIMHSLEDDALFHIKNKKLLLTNPHPLYT